MKDDPSRDVGQEAERPLSYITRRATCPLIWPDGTVREALLGLAWEPTDPLAVLVRVAVSTPRGDKTVAGTWTIARSALGDLVRYGATAVKGGAFAGIQCEGQAYYRLTLGARGGVVELVVPMLDVVHFLAATDHAVPAGSACEGGIVAADLSDYLTTVA